MKASPKLSIAMVCDFFFPRLGGVENHIYSLSQHLIRQGHKVVIITHAYGNRKGVRYLPGPLKVYYCPIQVMVIQDIMPTFTATLPLMRSIFLREGVQVVHAHQATSTMANESVVYASALGIASVYTDHSLFGFDDLASIILNRVLQTSLSTVDAAICVSKACRDNLIRRARLDPTRVSVIGNSVDIARFVPDPTKRSRGRVTIVIVSRLVYRKGADLMLGIIPRVCELLDNVDFIVGGNGPKIKELQNMVKKEGLQKRVEFLGPVPHDEVRNVLTRGHIFLNCSLTESFCIAILEAASCGLFVVSTNVGGIPEVLPDDLVLLSDPDVNNLVKCVERAVAMEQHEEERAWKTHERIRKMYSWDLVAEETAIVYNRVVRQRRRDFWERMECYLSIGWIAGFVVCCLALIVEFWLRIVEIWQPAKGIEVVPNLVTRTDETSIGKKLTSA